MKPLTDEEFEGLKQHYKDDEKSADVHALIATVESLKIWANALEKANKKEFEKRKEMESKLKNGGNNDN